MPTRLAKREITKREAQERTAKHKKDFAAIEKSWFALGKEVAESVALQVPAKLGMTMRDWLDKTFSASSSHIFRQLQNLRALDGVPDAKLEQMSESNAHELATKLPEKIRKSPEMVEKAINLPPAEFKREVAAIRQEKFGITPSKYRTFAVCVPIKVYEFLKEAEAKMARVLQLDLQDEDARTKNLMTVWECIAQLVNSTDEAWLKVETEGGGPLEEYQISKANGHEAHAQS